MGVLGEHAEGHTQGHWGMWTNPATRPTPARPPTYMDAPIGATPIKVGCAPKWGRRATGAAAAKTLGSVAWLAWLARLAAQDRRRARDAAIRGRKLGGSKKGAIRPVLARRK